MALYGRTLEINVTQLDYPFISTSQKTQALVTDIPKSTASGVPANNEVPSISYMQNVLPQMYGYSSLDKVGVISGSAPTLPFFHIIPFVADDGLNYLAGIADDAIYICRAGESSWSKFDFGGTIAPYWVTTMRLNGLRFFSVSGYDLYYFDTPTRTLQPANFVGLIPQNIFHITAASGYAIAADDATIYWDNPSHRSGSTLDFTPQVGGAGSTRLEQLAGAITAVHPLANGFIVYSATNAIAAQYSGDVNYPWIFTEIPGSSGVTDIYKVAFSSNRMAHIAYTRAGLQEISFTSATNIYPEVTDFLRQRILETYAFGTGLVRTSIDPLDFDVKMQFVAQRFALLSFGTSGYQQTLVFDVDLKRWGKINLEHVSMFEFELDQKIKYLSYDDLDAAGTTYASWDAAGTRYLDLFTGSGLPSYLNTKIGVCDANGNLSLILLSDYEKAIGLTRPKISPDFASILCIGRISMYKDRPTQIYEVEMQNIFPSALDDAKTILAFECLSSMVSDPFLPGSEITTIYPRQRSASSARFTFRKTAYSFGFAIGGVFQLTNIMAFIQAIGKR